MWYVRAVFGLYSNIGEDLEADALPCETDPNLLHSVKLIDSRISDYADSLGAHVLEVHTDLLSDARAEADGRSGHLKGVLLLAGMA